MDKVSIVLVNYNGAAYNEECLKSIYESYCNIVNIEVIMVDNCSKDNSIEKVKEKFKETIIIENYENNGFAGGTNIGIKYAMNNDSDYILLLNNDTIIDKDMIENMVRCSKANGNSVVTPKIYYFSPNDLIWSAGGKIKWNQGKTEQFGFNEKEEFKYEDNKLIDFATGCCMLIPNKVLSKIGDLEERYFLYYEDTDYCVRIKNAGCNLIYEPKAKMYHKVSASTGGDTNKLYIYYNTRSRLYFNKKYNKKYKIFIMYFAIAYIRNCIKWLIKNRLDLLEAMNDAIKDFIKGLEYRSYKY